MSWLHRLLGKDGVTQAAIDQWNSSLRISSRPAPVGTRGAYSLSLTSGVMAASMAANSEIFQFRWTHPTYLMLLRSVRLEAAVNTTAFTAGDAVFSGRIARSWTVDGTGGTAAIFGTHDQKKKTSFATTVAPSNSSVRISSTAALGVGTKTLDGNDWCGLLCGTTGAAGSSILAPGTYLWERDTPDEWPFDFTTNEGFVIRGTVPATGTWQFNVDLEWSEIDPAQIDGW